MKSVKYTTDISNMKLPDHDREYLLKDNQKSVFENLLNHAAVGLYPQGLSGATQRSFGRILNALDLTKSDYIELETSEYELLKSLFDDKIPFSPHSVRMVLQIRTSIEIATQLPVNAQASE
jgi:ABC-type arginine transport system ATPase subunit